MAIPSQTLTVDETGLPVTATGRLRPLLIGTSTAGSDTAVTTLTSAGQVRSTLGYGPLATDAAYVLRHGGPVDVLRGSTSATGTAGSVTKTGSAGAGDMSVSAGTPYDRYSVRVEVLTTGALGAATVRYSLDAWADNPSPAYSDALTVPANGEVVLTNTGMTVDFDDALGAGDVYTFETTAPPIATADITAIATNNLLLPYLSQFDFVALAGTPATCTLADALADVLDPVLSALESSGQRKPGILGAGEAGGTIGDYAVVSSRLCGMYGEAGVTSPLPITGLGVEQVGAHVPLVARVAGNLISTDPIRVASGPLASVQWITHDEFVEQSIDDDRVGTLRTWPGNRGFYVTNAWMQSAANSSIRYFQHALVLARACTVAAAAQARYIGASIRTGAGGVVAEADALAIERDVFNQLAAALLQPKNAEGTKGHVSALSYTIDRSVSLLSTERIEAELSIQPLGYPRTITTTVGFRAIAT